MNPVQRPDSYAGDYVGVVRRRWWVVLVLFCVGMAATLAYLVVTPAVYIATAAVYVDPTGAYHNNQVADSRTGGPLNLDTEAQVIVSGAVAGAAGQLMHSPRTAGELSQHITVTVPPNSEILDISCTGPSGAQAAACANAFAQAYLQHRSSSASTLLNQQIDALQDTVNTLQKPVATLNTRITALTPSSADRVSDETQLRSYHSQLRLLNSQKSFLQREAADVNGGHVITEAIPATHPDTPRRSLVVPSGVAGGLALGLLGAFAWDRRDKRIRGAKDAERFLDLRVLLNRPNAFGGQVSLAPVRSRTGQAFTELAISLAATLGEGNHVLVVAGASPGPGGSVTAANLAAALARTQSEAVLVCEDPDSTVSPGILGVGKGPGLAEVIAGSASLPEVARGTAAVPGLWVVTPGADASLVDYFMEHDRVRDLVSQLRRDARYVIIEAQAAEDGADTFAFAEFADAAVVTVEAAGTTSTEAGECVRRLRHLRVPVLGVAVIARTGRGARVRPAPAASETVGAGAGRTGKARI
ncbi:MAG TPA: Wzz/FepE/Etk N-terminal domain-containing protein [Streptosporangiaceae bacterium]